MTFHPPTIEDAIPSAHADPAKVIRRARTAAIAITARVMICSKTPKAHCIASCTMSYQDDRRAELIRVKFRSCGDKEHSRSAGQPAGMTARPRSFGKHGLSGRNADIEQTSPAGPILPSRPGEFHPRRTLLHLSYSCAWPFWNGDARDTRP